jgi:hypothetical protein
MVFLVVVAPDDNRYSMSEGVNEAIHSTIEGVNEMLMSSKLVIS